MHCPLCHVPGAADSLAMLGVAALMEEESERRSTHVALTHTQATEDTSNGGGMRASEQESLQSGGAESVEGETTLVGDTELKGPHPASPRGSKGAGRLSFTMKRWLSSGKVTEPVGYVHNACSRNASACVWKDCV